METQPLLRPFVARSLAAAVALAMCGCAPTRRVPPAYSLVAVGPSGSPVRLYRSDHFLLYSTLVDESRIGQVIATLEAAFDAYVSETGVHPAADAPPMSVFLFLHRDEWESFTRSRTGDAAPTYLKLDRGGYTFGKFCAVREQGDQDTLRVLAHEGFHLFVATHFEARPPPFLEEGLATLFESPHLGDDGVATISVGESAARIARLKAITERGGWIPLRQLLTMHAGNVIGLPGTEVDGFYAQAWTFARFLAESDGGARKPALQRLLSDAASGALSSDRLDADPALVERYLGTSLDMIEPAYRQFAARLTGRGGASE